MTDATAIRPTFHASYLRLGDEGIEPDVYIKDMFGDCAGSKQWTQHPIDLPTQEQRS